uniref:Uncharacterized protein n=1 Tax=Trichogramma kaykai TaxID=54128 RepID=A0ABD2W152_9HYME
MSARRKFHCTRIQCLARDSSDYKRVARTRAKQTILHYVYSSTTSAPRARVLLYIYKTRRMKHSSPFCTAAAAAAAVRVHASVRM